MAVNDIVMGASGSSGVATYIEDVFSTYLYTGTGATQTITNGIDLSGKGGLVWTKARDIANGHALYYTANGVNSRLQSHTTAALGNTTGDFTSFGSTGYTVGTPTQTNELNQNTKLFVSWTFRKQAKFFDVVTYTGNGANRTIAHNLGSVPSMIIVKRTDTSGDWQVYHRSLANTQYMVLNSTAAVATGATRWNSTTPTSSVFSLGTDATVNASGGTYVAYIYAHDAGGFGTSGTDNVISCGSYTGTGTTPGPSVTLGYEPQWVIWKRTDAGTESWHIRDNIRGMPVTASGKDLYADLSSAEGSTTNEGAIPTATGFQIIGTNTNANASGATYIYIAIRRPMKTPTTGTEVFAPVLGSGTAPGYVSGFPVDLGIERNKSGTSNTEAGTRLTDARVLKTNSTAIEAASTNTKFDYMNGFFAGTKGTSEIAWMFRRAPGFFDVVCYTGTGVARTVNHNLGVVPEMFICKCRNAASTNWAVYHSGYGNTGALLLNLVNTANVASSWYNNTSPTSSVFTIGVDGDINGSTRTYVAYLFATCAGVSKVGSYTGNGSSQTIACGFTAGARFVLIKRTDSTGDWYVWDTARGIVAGNDPHLSLNTTAAEVTTDDSIDTDNGGFIVNQVAATNINVTSATYIFLAIA
jgi:hypothetical protein